jgi:hypothetical protein
MNTIFGLTVALMLVGGGVWANVCDGGVLSHTRGSWVSH